MDATLSPARGQTPQIPLFILHGAMDNVIPASEGERLYEWAYRYADARLLISDRISHVELNGEPFRGLTTYWSWYQLTRFWSDLLRA